jgi:enoyl-CoA hydratase
MSEIITERRGCVLVVRINRPDARNALNVPVMAGIGNAFIEADEDPGIRAVVLTGTGDKVFSAGLDLKALAAGLKPAKEEQRGMQVFTQFLAGGGGCAEPVIGAAQATALAGGFELLLGCDLAVVADDARLGLPEVKRGLFAAGGAMYLARRIPLAKALELTLTGAPFTPAQALDLGLINAVAPAGQVLDRAIEFANLISEGGPLGIRATKRLVRLAAFEPLADVRKVHDELWKSVSGSKDAKEGNLAFRERRAPVWKGI